MDELGRLPGFFSSIFVDISNNSHFSESGISPSPFSILATAGDGFPQS